MEPTAPPSPPGPAPVGAGRHRLDPRQRQVWTVAAVLAAVAAAAFVALVDVVVEAAGGDVPGPRGAAVLAVLAAGLALAWWWPRLAHRHWSYELTDTTLELRHGVVVRNHSAVPYFRVQHVDITAGPVQRLLGLATLVVHTASASTDAKVPGVAGGDAVAVRDLVLARAGRGDAV